MKPALLNSSVESSTARTPSLLAQVGLGLTLMWVMTQKSMAGTPLDTQQGFRPDVAVDTDFGTAIRSFMNFFLGFLGLLAVLMIIYAGVLLITANGDQDNIDRGKSVLLWAGIGIILVMLSYAIVSLIFTAGDLAGNTA